jgi:hypothetical protein
MGLQPVGMRLPLGGRRLLQLNSQSICKNLVKN